jgi:spermidine/putrescine transport system permease protein
MARLFSASGLRALTLRALVAVVYGFLFVPILVVLAFSFDGSSIPIYPLNDLTTKWYAQLFGQYFDSYMQPLFNSLQVAFMTSIVATVLGAMAGFAMSRYDFPGSDVYPFVLATPAMVPPLITGIALLGFLSQTLGVRMSLFTTALGHIVLTMPFAAFIVAGQLGPEEDYERAARDLGANTLAVVREVTLPLLAPALLASVLITFTISLGESAMVFLLSGSKTVLPIALQSRLASTITPRFNAISMVVIVLTFGLFAIAEVMRRRF